jgi:nucleolar MIF4G domain-containing protein 1
MKLVKLSLKKQQEREIMYVIFHCALNEKAYNPYYSYLLQKFCEYDRRFKMTLQFHTWDKFKLITSMTKQQLTNFAQTYVHLLSCGAMPMSVLKNVEFGEMDKSMLTFLRELFTSLFTKHTHEQLQELFMRIANVKKFNHLTNALKLFIVHFMLTDKGKSVEIDQYLKEKCDFVQKILSINSATNF